MKFPGPRVVGFLFDNPLGKRCAAGKQKPTNVSFEPKESRPRLS